MRALTTIALSATLALAITGCTRNRNVAADLPNPGGYDQNGGGTGAGGVGGAAVPGSQADFVASVQADTIYFDTDASNIDDADRAVLASQAQWLARYPNVRITLEGHCDERGTREYNLALGDRRATAARNYLVSLGVSAARINVVSYGKERPVALGSDEGSYARNRRAVSVTIQ